MEMQFYNTAKLYFYVECTVKFGVQRLESFILKLYLHRNLKGILLYAQAASLHIRANR